MLSNEKQRAGNTQLTILTKDIHVYGVDTHVFVFAIQVTACDIGVKPYLVDSVLLGVISQASNKPHRTVRFYSKELLRWVHTNHSK